MCDPRKLFRCEPTCDGAIKQAPLHRESLAAYPSPCAAQIVGGRAFVRCSRSRWPEPGFQTRLDYDEPSGLRRNSGACAYMEGFLCARSDGVPRMGERERPVRWGLWYICTSHLSIGTEWRDPTLSERSLGSGSVPRIQSDNASGEQGVYVRWRKLNAVTEGMYSDTCMRAFMYVRAESSILFLDRDSSHVPNF